MRPACGSAMVLNTKAENGASGRGLARDRLALLERVRALHLAPVGGRGQELDDGVEERMDADVAHRGGGQHGEDAPGQHGLAQALARGPPGRGCPCRRTPPSGPRCSRPPSRRALAASCVAASLISAGTSTASNLPALVVVRRRRPSSVTRSATPTKPFSSPRGMARGDHARPNARCSDVQRALEGGAVAVHPVHHDEAREARSRPRSPRPSRSGPPPPPRRPRPPGRRRPPAGPSGPRRGRWRSRGRRAG